MQRRDKLAAMAQSLRSPVARLFVLTGIAPAGGLGLFFRLQRLFPGDGAPRIDAEPAIVHCSELVEANQRGDQFYVLASARVEGRAQLRHATIAESEQGECDVSAGGERVLDRLPRFAFLAEATAEDVAALKEIAAHTTDAHPASERDLRRLVDLGWAVATGDTLRPSGLGQALLEWLDRLVTQERSAVAGSSRSA